MDRRICITVVNYFNDKEVVNFVGQYLKNDPELAVYIVNNGSNDSSFLKKSIHAFSNVTLIDTQKNSGYLGAFYESLLYRKQAQLPLPDYFILSNTDLEFKTEDWKNELYGQSMNNSIGVIGPEIFSTLTKSEQNPFKMERVKSSRLNMLITLFSIYPAYIIYQTLYYLKAKLFSRNRKETAQAISCYAVHGSFMILTKEFLQFAQTDLRNAPFLFSEELFLAELCRKYGLTINYFPQIKLIHHEHSTTGIYKSRRIVKMMADSLRIIKSSFY